MGIHGIQYSVMGGETGVTVIQVGVWGLGFRV